VGGPLRVSEQRSPRGIDRAPLEACVQAGIPRIADYNGPEQDGARLPSSSKRNAELVRAQREVLLSAGAIGSPQRLLLSGIGPGDELRQVGVPVRHELPGVGRNLQDHPFVTIIWEVSDERTLCGADKSKPFAEWLLRRTGPLSSTVAEVVAFVRSRPGLPAADIQLHMGAAYFDDHGAEEYDGHCIAIGPSW
jgi:choline dehydrogenase